MVGVPDGASRQGIGEGLVLCLTASQSLSGVIERGVEAPQARQLLLLLSDLQQLLCDGSCSRDNIWRIVVELNLHVCSECQCLCQVPAIPHSFLFFPKRKEMFKSKQLALAAELLPFGRRFYPKWFTVL